MIKTISISKLKPNKWGFKKKSEKQIKELETSLSGGIIGHNIVVDEDFNIINGEQIYNILLKQGVKEVEVEVVEKMSERERKEMSITDNIVAEESAWDKDKARIEKDKIHAQDTNAFSLYDMSFLKVQPKIVRPKKSMKLIEIECNHCGAHFNVKKK